MRPSAKGSHGGNDKRERGERGRSCIGDLNNA